VNKYLHTVASVGFLFTLNYDAWNHELKTKINMNFSIRALVNTILSIQVLYDKEFPD